MMNRSVALLLAFGAAGCVPRMPVGALGRAAKPAATVPAMTFKPLTLPRAAPLEVPTFKIPAATEAAWAKPRLPAAEPVWGKPRPPAEAAKSAKARDGWHLPDLPVDQVFKPDDDDRRKR